MHWKTPKVMTPLVLDLSGFVSRSIELGVDARLMDETARTAMGYMLGEDGQVVHVSVPFGAPGGYRMVFARQTSNQCCIFFQNRKTINILCCLLQSVVENNVYKESYTTFLCYEHIYLHVFTDDTEIETRHRQLRVIETPLVSRIPFAIDGEIINIPLYNRLTLFLWLMQVNF